MIHLSMHYSDENVYILITLSLRVLFVSVSMRSCSKIYIWVFVGYILGLELRGEWVLVFLYLPYSEDRWAGRAWTVSAKLNQNLINIAYGPKI